MATSLEQRAVQDKAWLGDPWTPVTVTIERDTGNAEHVVRRQRFNGGLLEEFDGETWAYPERNVFGSPFP